MFGIPYNSRKKSIISDAKELQFEPQPNKHRLQKALITITFTIR